MCMICSHLGPNILCARNFRRCGASLKNYQSRVKESVDSQAVFQSMSDFILNVRCLPVFRKCKKVEHVLAWVTAGWLVGGSVKGLKGQLVH